MSIDVQEIIQLKRDMEPHFAAFQAQCRRADELYDLNIKVKVPKPYLAYIPPTARAKVDAALAHTITRNPAVVVVQTRGTENAQRQADALEFAYDALLQRLDEDQPSSLWEATAKQALIYGLGVRKMPLWLPLGLPEPKRRNREATGDFNRRKAIWQDRVRNHLPIATFSVYPTSLLWEPGHWPPRWVIETSELPAAYIMARYGINLDKKPGDMVVWDEYWDADERCFMVDGMPVQQVRQNGKWLKFSHPQDNALGFIPYLFASPGFGRPSVHPEEEFVGLLTPLEPVLLGEARWKTAVQALAEESVWKGQLVKGMDATKFTPPVMGERQTVPDEAQIIPMPSNPIPPDLLRLLGILQADLDVGAGPGILGGLKSPGEPSGYGAAVRVGQGALKVATLTESMSRMASTFLRNVARMVDIMGEPVEVWGVQGTERLYAVLKPGELGNFRAFVNFEPTSPEMADRKIMLAVSLYQARMMSLQSLSERFMGVKDWTTERLRMMVEAILTSPQAVAIQAQTALEESGMIELKGQLEAGAGGPRGAVPERREVVKEIQRLQGETISGQEGLGAAPETQAIPQKGQP